jgi:integrase
VVPLPPLAVAILQARLASLPRPPTPEDLVVPTVAHGGLRLIPYGGWFAQKGTLNRLTGIAGWVLHDFRRSIVSNCAEAGGDLAALDSILNHASSATRGGIIGVYQRATLLEPMRRMTLLWDSLLSNAINPPARANVVPIKTQTATATVATTARRARTGAAGPS